MRSLRAAVLCSLVFMGSSASVIAQPYPVRPVRVIVPFAPGGGNDLIARIVAQKLSERLGQQFVVDNRVGGGGIVGTELGVRAVPDGYTINLLGGSHPVNANLYRLNFDPIEDITPIVQISQGPFIVVVHPSLPVKTLRELVAMARARPGAISYASHGMGGIGHLSTEYLLSMAGVRMLHVP